jgi:hypothetical protein
VEEELALLIAHVFHVENAFQSRWVILGVAPIQLAKTFQFAHALDRGAGPPVFTIGFVASAMESKVRSDHFRLDFGVVLEAFRLAIA